MSSQSPVIESFCSKPSIFVENCIKLTLSGCPREFSHRDMYIALSSGHTSFNFNMPFQTDSKETVRLFSIKCLEWKYCTFWKIDGNPFQFTKTILALIMVGGWFFAKCPFSCPDTLTLYRRKICCSSILFKTYLSLSNTFLIIKNKNK